MCCGFVIISCGFVIIYRGSVIICCGFIIICCGFVISQDEIVSLRPALPTELLGIISTIEYFINIEIENKLYGLWENVYIFSSKLLASLRVHNIFILSGD